MIEVLLMVLGGLLLASGSGLIILSAIDSDDEFREVSEEYRRSQGWSRWPSN